MDNLKSFKDYLIEKPLTPQQRIQRGRIMKRLAPRLAMKRKIAAKKKASISVLKARADKKARETIRKKFTKGADYNSMTPAQKVAIDKRVEAKKALISKLAKKLLPSIKKAEQERLKKLKTGTKGTK